MHNLFNVGLKTLACKKNLQHIWQEKGTLCRVFLTCEVSGASTQFLLRAATVLVKLPAPIVPSPSVHRKVGRCMPASLVLLTSSAAGNSFKLPISNCSRTARLVKTPSLFRRIQTSDQRAKFFDAFVFLNGIAGVEAVSKGSYSITQWSSQCCYC